MSGHTFAEDVIDGGAINVTVRREAPVLFEDPEPSKPAPRADAETANPTSPNDPLIRRVDLAAPTLEAPVATPVPTIAPVSAAAAAPKTAATPDDGRPIVRLLAIKTDVAKKYKWIVPPFPIPPFMQWKEWFANHTDAVHCSVEWRNENGEWFHGEMRSTHFDLNAEQYRVGFGEFPGTAYDAYGIYIMPGQYPRDKDSKGKPVEIAMEEIVPCDYRDIEREVRAYGRKDRLPGDPGTGGDGRQNRGLGGPAYKPAQNSNTMIKYVLRACGYKRAAPDLAVGWDREPHFPYSSDADTTALDSRP